MSVATNVPRPWSKGDCARLRKFARARLSARIAAAKLRRSPGATRFKAMVLGVSFRSTNRRVR